MKHQEGEERGGEKGKRRSRDKKRKERGKEGEAGKEVSNSQVKEEIVEAFLRDTVMETNWKRVSE